MPDPGRHNGTPTRFGDKPAGCGGVPCVPCVHYTGGYGPAYYTLQTPAGNFLLDPIAPGGRDCAGGVSCGYGIYPGYNVELCDDAPEGELDTGCFGLGVAVDEPLRMFVGGDFFAAAGGFHLFSGTFDPAETITFTGSEFSGCKDFWEATIAVPGPIGDGCVSPA